MIWWIANAAAWTVVGPERGQVLDIAMGPQEVLVTTRVGVLRTTPDSFEWQRDDRFPPDTKRVATWSGGAWGSPPSQLWEVTHRSKRLVQQLHQSVITDLEAQADGTVYVGWRGAESGLWKVKSNGEPERLIPNVEPWTIVLRDKEVWVGTLEHGLWFSEDGSTFQQRATGSVATVAQVGSDIWIATPNGDVYDAVTQKHIVQIAAGFPTHIADMGDRVFFTVSSPTLKEPPFQVLKDGQLTPIVDMQVDADSGFVTSTGAWPLPDGSALVGSFRRGPLRWKDKWSTLRTGFHATVSGGAAIDKFGRIAMAFMGTGVYLYDDGVVQPHPTEGPVTDSVFTTTIDGLVTVVDFEGIKVLEEDGSWRQEKGVPDEHRRIGNTLTQVAKSNDVDWWAIDIQKRLWHRQAEGDWQKCQLTGVIRLDGSDDDLVVVTQRGFVRPGCAEVEVIDVPNMDTQHSRAWGDWIATSEFLYYQAKPILDIPKTRIDALIADGEDAVIIAPRGKSLLRCTTESCTELGPAIPEPILSLGRLPDGRLWFLEQRGSLWVDDGTDVTPKRWYDFTERRVQFGQFTQLYRNPWLRGGKTIPLQFLFTPLITKLYYVGGVLFTLLCGLLLRWRRRTSQ